MSILGGYNGNPLLKKAATPLDFTPEQGKELVRCSADPQYFLDQYFFQKTVDFGLVRLKMWSWQRKLIKLYHKHRFVITKIPRQSGKTTVTIGYILWYILFNADKTVGMLAQKELVAIELLDRLKIAYEQLPLWMQQGILTWNETSVELENGSRVLSEATSSGSIRGFTINLLYCDEFAHIPHNIAEQFNSSVYPTIQSGKTSKMFISSTPKGLNLYYKFWTDAKNKLNGFVPFEVDYTQIPGHDKEWAEKEKTRLGDRLYQQEVLCEFLGSAGTLIMGTVLRALAFNPHRSEPIPNLLVWETPLDKHLYAMTVDTAEGTGLDYSAFLVLDITEMPYRVVARYRDNHVETLVYPAIIARAARYYNDAYVLLENNNLGGQVGDLLFNEFEYDNLFYSMSKPNLGIEALQNTSSRKIGLRTTPKTKMIGCSALKQIVENQQVILNDMDAIAELSVFVLTKTGQYKAEPGYNDDLAMCLVLFAWLTQQPIFKDLTQHDLRKRMFERRLQDIEKEMIPHARSTGGIPNKKEGGRMANMFLEKNADGSGKQIWEIVNNSGRDAAIDPEPNTPYADYKDFFSNE